MSRQVARTRKKHKAGDADSKFEVLRKIHQTSSITSKDIVQLYSIDKPLCHGCRVNSRDSPNCFCGLVPTSSGSRRNGLWQKLSDLVTSVVGLDPSVDQRSPEDCPAGLTNAGATCYANSILQCLYMNVKFRAGIFSVEPDLLKQHLVLEQLVHLFSQLHSSRKAVIDSLPFVKMLELDKGSQQDSHEFLTLFLSLLERSLSHSKVHRAKMLVQDLFRGSVSHVTRCSMCGKDSEASSKVDDFYGLELYIKGFDNLDSSLDDYLSVEHLCGQNQYFCQSCNIRVDATRCIKLRALPAVLIFQLKRYDFLMEMTKKKKLTSSFSFPNQLNMGTRLDAASDTKLWYDLSAVLIHKGSAATSGHYVARIKDENNGIWWEFDDETVIKLGHQPFGESLSVTTGGVQSTSNGTKEHPEIFSPTDAYMLIYCCTHSQKYVDLDARDAGMVVPNNNSALPAHLSEKIEIANGLFIEACRNYQAKKDALIAHITERRLEVKQILSEAQVHSIEDCFFWVSLDWLRQWADSFDLPWADQSNLMQVDNSVIQCSHGKVSADKVSSMKRMSVSAWSKIFYKYGGGPALSNDDYCVECLKEEALNYVSADDYRDRSITMKRIAEAALAGDCDDGESYYVSRTWLSHWLRRKHLDNPCDLEAGPTSSLICPHGNMLPEKASGAKRVRIPENLWLFLLESINAAKSGTFSHQAFPEEDSQTCKTCSKELSDFASLASTLRESKLNQQQSHEKLFLGKTISLSPGHKYFLMPSSWLAKWKAYITTTGRGGSSTEPECLGVIINSFKCHKHGRLLERPPKLICKRGLITHSSNVDGLTMVPESDWKLFCKEWKAEEERGLSAQVVPVKEAESGRVFLSDPEICSRSPDVPTSCELEPEDLTIRTDTEICEVCIGERESCELMHKLNYSDGEISVHLIRGKEVPKWLLEAHIAKASDPDRRTSKRSRRSLSGQVCNLSVSSTTTVYQLRMMIWEYFGVVKENQKLHKGSVELEGDSATLADKNIFPGDALWVSDSQVHENRDIAEELSEPKSESREAEEGFRGTLLVSDASPFVFEVFRPFKRYTRGFHSSSTMCRTRASEPSGSFDFGRRLLCS